MKPSFLKKQIEITSLLKDKNASWPIKIAFLLIGFSWLGLVFFWGKLPPEVPLLYSKPWGEEQLVKKPFILFLPGLATIFTLINLRLASYFFKTKKPISYFLIWFNFVTTLLAVITYWKILFIIT